MFLCNTLADDETIVYTVKSTQTAESGGLTTENATQTLCGELKFITVLTDNCLSSTTVNPEKQTVSDSDCSDSENSQPDSTSVFNSYSNTIISFLE